RPGVGSRVENSGRQCALPLWKPFRDRLDRARENRGLADAEQRARERETSRGARECMCNGGQTPSHDCPAESASDTNPVNDLAGEKKSKSVRETEPRHDVAVIRLAPAESVLQRRRKNAEHLAVDVVDRR